MAGFVDRDALGLRDQGRQHARTWLDANYGKVGQRSSVEIADLFY